MLFLPSLLLTTKLYRPPADANWVARPALFARLNEGLSCKLTLLSAPPGFGKTTLASQWLASCGRPSAWLSLDQGDNDLAQFLRYLIAAVQTCVAEACPMTQALLSAPELPSVDYLAALLVSELTALTEPLILLLDDYHTIHTNAVHQVVRHLLRYLPPALHLVILTRKDPPLPLGRLRIAEQVTELRARDLRFALAEARHFLDHRLDQPLADDALQMLHTRTEGWITGLQLASLSLQGHDSRQALTHFHGSDRLLVGYLMEEVFAPLPDTLRDFLLRTALVDRFCAPLADALLTDSPTPVSSRALIAQLEEQNLFLIPLDNEGEWYRYHDLFRDFLNHRLKRIADPATVASLHQRASVWLAQAGWVEEALHHALTAGDETGAAELVAAHLPSVLNQQVIEVVLARWLHLFAEQTINSHLGPLMARGVLWTMSWQHAHLPPVLAQIATMIEGNSTLPPERRQFFQALLDVLQGMLCFWRGAIYDAKAHLEAALQDLAPVHLTVRAQATFYLAWAYLASGEAEAGFSLLRTALVEAMTQEHFTSAPLMGAFILNHFYLGQLTEAAAAARRVLAQVDAADAPKAWQGVTIVEAWRRHAHFYLGLTAYEQNDLETASQHWRELEAPSNQVNFRTHHESLLGLALLAHVRGDANQALAYAQAAREVAENFRNPMLLALSEAFEVRLALLSGQIAEAVSRSQAIDAASNQAVFRGLETPRLTRLHALLAEATPASLTAAHRLAEECLQQAESAHNIRQVIQILALHALVLHALRNQAEAFHALARALTLGEPGGFVRTFLDLGALMAALLRTFAAQRGASPYLKRLLAGFASNQSSAQRQGLTAQYVKLHGITPLTPREIELLALIAQRLSIKEIAATLVIAPSTVKNHTHHIYTKLGVRNGRQAVAKAQELGLLPPA